MRDVESAEASQLGAVEERLIVRFCPPLRPDEVQRHLIGTIASFEHARVRIYVPILVERAATRHLELAVAIGATAPQRRAERATCAEPATTAPATLVAPGTGA